MKNKKKPMSAWALVVALVFVVVGSVVFVSAVAGWFSDKAVTLSEEYYNSSETEFLELDKIGYEDLVADKKSFIVFVDQENCKTADNLQGFLQNYMTENKIVIYKMMFSEMRGTPLHEKIKYYPSVAIISGGEAVSYLRADEDEDSDIYNKNDAFDSWINSWVKLDIKK